MTEVDKVTGEVFEEPGTERVDAELVPVSSASAIEAYERAQIDTQISTAKRYPRQLESFRRNGAIVLGCIDKAKSMATRNVDTAEACTYCIPRAGKNIIGPSTRLAEIMVACWGNLRVAGRVSDITPTQVVAEGVCHDLESNVAVRVEVRRSILDSKGKRYSDDMIRTTCLSAISIAQRNAALKVIPKVYTDEVREFAVTKSKEGVSLEDRRDKALAYFQKLGIDNSRVFNKLKVAEPAAITWDHMAILSGMATAIKDGSMSAEDAFPEENKAASFDDLPSGKSDFGFKSGADGKAQPPAKDKPEQPAVE